MLQRGTEKRANCSTVTCGYPKAAETAEKSNPKATRSSRFVTNKWPLKIGSKTPPAKNTGFHNLESVILLLIFSNMSEKELALSVSRVCRHWWNVARNPRLWKSLEFKGDKIDAITICDRLRKCPNLENLSLYDMKDPATLIRQMCRCNRWVKRLKIKNCRGGEDESIPESVLRNILHSCRGVESLNLKSTQFSSTRFYHELANLPNLRKLNLSNNKYLQAKDLMTIALNCRKLEDISLVGSHSDLDSPQITDQDAIFFFRSLCNSLKRVDFDTTGLTAPSFQAILSCPYLEHLSLRNALFLTGDIFRAQTSKLRGLKQLRLTQASQLVSDDFTSLSKTRVFDRLTLVDLSGCWRISDVGLKTLLQRCKDKLTYLSLKSCKSMNDLNFILENCKKLQYLNIAHASGMNHSCVKNLPSINPNLTKLVIDNKTLSYHDLMMLHTRVPKLTLMRSMSEFHKDEFTVCAEDDSE